MKQFGSVALATIACALAACGGSTVPMTSASGTTLVRTLGHDTTLQFTLPKNTIGEELPSEGVKTKKDPTWGSVGGFTQSTTAQVLAFPPGTKVTIKNLSGAISHTLNVVAKRTKPPANFPANPSLSTQPHGGNVLALGYASGVISPGKSITVTLSNKGNYLIGCAFHYHDGMQDVVRVFARATPGPT